MNEKQRLYLVQARSDWAVYNLLKSQPICHRLHYLQMCTEKLAKAFFWRSASAGNLHHAAFVKFLRALKTQSKVATELNYGTSRNFGEWIHEILDLAYELERLAPQLAGNGPNPEYPWPRNDPEHSPVEHHFQAWGHLESRKGRHLQYLIEAVLKHFEQWF